MAAQKRKKKTKKKKKLSVETFGIFECPLTQTPTNQDS